MRRDILANGMTSDGPGVSSTAIITATVLALPSWSWNSLVYALYMSRRQPCTVRRNEAGMINESCPRSPREPPSAAYGSPVSS